MTVLFALTGPFATTASAQCTPNAGPFCIDGVISDTDNSGVAGPASPPGPQALITIDPAGNAAELGPINGSNTKINVIHTAVPPMLGLNRQNSQVDLNKVYTQSALHLSDLWFYFGWVRDSNNGSGFIAIEFQRGDQPVACDYDEAANAELIAGCNPYENRADGDFIILWDQNGNSTNISYREFQGGAFQPSVPLGAGEALAVYGNAASGGTFRGEMAINFSAIVQPSQNECLTFANVIPSTVTGNSDTADYKDTVLSDFPLLTNCGIVTVKKVTSPASSPGTFQYTLADSAPIFGVTSPDSDCSETGSNLNTCIGTLVHDATDEISDLLADVDYTLVESDIPANFGLTSIICTTEGGTVFNITAGGVFTVEAGKKTACVITNTVLTGLLRIIKTVVNGFGLTKAPGDFKYTLNGGDLTAFVQGVNGASCAAPNADSVCQQFTFDVGTVHNVVEPSPGGQLAGYNVSYDGCSNVTIVAGSPQTCTVTNTALQNTVTATTQQRVLLFDRATVTGLRRVAGDNASMTVTFSAYANLDDCIAKQNAVAASEVVNLNLPDDLTVTSKQVGTTGSPEVFIEANGNPADTTTVRYWRAVFTQTGTSPANAPITTSCNEITTVQLQQ